jgi:4-hydroxybenzoate polyprenyltransferase
VDAEIDARNPRTRGREIPAGKLRRSTVATATVAFAALFLVAAGMLNGTALLLSPIVLVLLLGYSFTKRFTLLSHLVLGVSLGLAPLGAWVAVLGERCLEGVGVPILLGGAVVLWVAGFDIIYSCMDVEFDRRASLHSIPQRFGVDRALRISSRLHVGTAILLAAVAVVGGTGPIYPVAVLAVAVLLWREHRIVRPEDLSRVNEAFFTLNGIVGLVLLAACVADLVLFGVVP